MNNDRELLEMAAKAAGISLRPMEMRNVGGEVDFIGFPTDADEWPRGWFNPLTNDGDALRLIARLRLRLDYRDGFVGVWKVGPYLGQCPHDEENPHDTTATRRAIVRAAAELGRAMP